MSTAAAAATETTMAVARGPEKPVAKVDLVCKGYNDLAADLLGQVGTYLTARELARVRCVSRHWGTHIDTDETRRLPGDPEKPDEPGKETVETRLQTVCSELFKIEKQKPVYETLRQKFHVTAETLMAKQKELVHLQKSWSSWFSVVPGAQSVSTAVHRTKVQVEALKQEIGRLEEEWQKLQTDCYLDREFLGTEISLGYKKAELEAWEKIANLFGGERSFERFSVRLPKLTLSEADQTEAGGYPTFEFSRMTSGVVQGVDHVGRKFIAIVAKNNKGLFGQIFFQRYTGSWKETSDSGMKDLPGLFHVPGYFIEGGKIPGQLNKCSYQVLAELIQTGKTRYTALTLATREDIIQEPKKQKLRVMRHLFYRAIKKKLGADFVTRLCNRLKSKQH